MDFQTKFYLSLYTISWDNLKDISKFHGIKLNWLVARFVLPIWIKCLFTFTSHQILMNLFLCFWLCWVRIWHPKSHVSSSMDRNVFFNGWVFAQTLSEINCPFNMKYLYLTLLASNIYNRFAKFILDKCLVFLWDLNFNIFKNVWLEKKLKRH
jgi:hypothetical protein